MQAAEGTKGSWLDRHFVNETGPGALSCLFDACLHRRCARGTKACCAHLTAAQVGHGQNYQNHQGGLPIHGA